MDCDIEVSVHILDEETEYLYMREYNMFKINKSPDEYGLPYENWWIGQDKIAERVLNNIYSGKTTILESPTGTGKSLLPALTTKVKVSPGNTTVLVSTRDLQQQYQDSFDWFDIIWGRRNYECILSERVEQWMALYGEKPSFEECQHVGNYSACKQFYSCPYLEAKRRAVQSRAKVLNYSYAYHAKWWHENPGVLFCDEAHILPDTIVNLTGIDIRKSLCKKYALDYFPIVNGSNKKAIEIVLVWISKAVQDVSNWIELHEQLQSDEKSLIQAINFLERMQIIKQALKTKTIEDDEWYVNNDKYNGILHIQPVYPTRYVSKILVQSKATILMSATIGRPDILASELNIDDYEFISTPHVIPENQRRIFLHSNAPKISAKSGIAVYANQARIIREIMDKHSQDKGIIHTASWKHAKTLAAFLKDTKRIMLTDGPRIETIQKFKESNQPLVAISPSWDHGLNFHGDDARFGVITKIPWLNWGNPVVNIRVNAKGGRDWYDWNACLKVVQACGRVVRGIDDWGYNYIVDANWNRVKRFAPQWFNPKEL